jgi:hypothetical protein
LADVRTTLDIQFKSITSLQAEMDILPAARRRREAVRAPALCEVVTAILIGSDFASSMTFSILCVPCD